MSRDSEIVPSSSSSNRKRASSTLQFGSRVGFWVQIVLGVIAGVTLLFASTALLGRQDRTQGIELGIFSAFGGLILLGVGIYFSRRYGKVALKLQESDSIHRPTRADVLQLIKIGLIIHLVGMLMTIFGAAAISGIVLLKSLSIPQGTLAANPKQFVQSIDLLAIQANVNAIMAHFAGIANSLWLLDRLKAN
jgi:hypothetical protein